MYRVPSIPFRVRHPALRTGVSARPLAPLAGVRRSPKVLAHERLEPEGERLATIRARECDLKRAAHGLESSWSFLIESWWRWPCDTSPRDAGKSREGPDSSRSSVARDVPYLPAIGSFPNRSHT